MTTMEDVRRELEPVLADITALDKPEKRTGRQLLQKLLQKVRRTGDKAPRLSNLVLVQHLIHAQTNRDDDAITWHRLMPRTIRNVVRPLQQFSVWSLIVALITINHDCPEKGEFVRCFYELMHDRDLAELRSAYLDLYNDEPGGEHYRLLEEFGRAAD